MNISIENFTNCSSLQKQSNDIKQIINLITIVSLIITSIGVLLNMLNVVVLLKSKLNESPYTYLTSLAFSDLSTLLNHLFNYFIRKTNIFSPKFQYYFTLYYLIPSNNFVLNCSMYFTLAVTVERFIFVHLPFKAVSICRRSIARKVCLSIFVFSALKNAYLPFTYEKSVCFEYGFQQTKSRSLDLFEFLINMALPYVFIFIINISLICSLNKTHYMTRTRDVPSKKISVRLRKSLLSRNKRANEDIGHVDDSNFYRHTGSSDKEARNQKKLTISLISILCLLLVCHLPSFLLEETLIDKLFGDNSHLAFQMHTIGNKISHLLTYTNCSANFIIYCVSNKKFYNSIKELIKNLKLSKANSKSVYISSSSYSNNKTSKISINSSLSKNNRKRSSDV